MEPCSLKFTQWERFIFTQWGFLIRHEFQRFNYYFRISRWLCRHFASWNTFSCAKIPIFSSSKLIFRHELHFHYRNRFCTPKMTIYHHKRQFLISKVYFSTLRTISRCKRRFFVVKTNFSSKGHDSIIIYSDWRQKS